MTASPALPAPESAWSALVRSRPELARLLLVVPTLNEEAGLPLVLAEAQRLGVAAVVVDSGSPDGPREAAVAFGAPVVRAPRGKGRAWRHFVETADLSAWEWVAMVDGDGTYDLSALPRLIRPGVDMVVGLRVAVPGETPRIRAFGARLLSLLAGWLLGVPCPDLLSGFRVFRADRLREIPVRYPGFELETELTMRFIRRGLRVEWVPVGYSRRWGESKLNPLADALRILRTMLRVRLGRP
jgi:glycosyltransferase involved in cell wall biosynthesis